MQRLDIAGTLIRWLCLIPLLFRILFLFRTLLHFQILLSLRIRCLLRTRCRLQIRCAIRQLPILQQCLPKGSSGGWNGTAYAGKRMHIRTVSQLSSRRSWTAFTMCGTASSLLRTVSGGPSRVYWRRVICLTAFITGVFCLGTQDRISMSTGRLLWILHSMTGTMSIHSIKRT